LGTCSPKGLNSTDKIDGYLCLGDKEWKM